MVLFSKYIKRYWKILILALVLATINQVFSLLDPQIFRLIMDNYLLKFDEIEKSVFLKGVGLLLLGLVGVALVSRIAKNFQDYYVNVITQNVGTDMYADGVNHTFSLPYAVFEDRRSGEILQVLQKSRNDSQALIQSMINTVFLSGVGIIFVLIYGFMVHWTIAATFFVLIPIMGTTMFFISKKIRSAQKEIVKESAELSGSTTETLRNVQLVKSLGLENQEITRLNNANDKILLLELKKIKLIRMLGFLQGTLINGVRSGLIFWMMWLVYTGTISVGEFFSLFFYTFLIFAPLGELANVVSQYQQAKASNEQLAEILKVKPEKKLKNAKVIGRINRIEMKDVSFRYNEGNKDSINGVNINISKGERVAFVGPSGSGKTTLTKLILGLYKPTKGNILFEGVDSKKIDYDDLRRRIGLVSQETQLFAGTIRDNLLFVNPKASDEKCVEYLRMASADHLLDRLGKGLDTKIGEGGIKLSGGEKQRLAIARALLREPEVIIFDEATSSLDSLTEKEITNTIERVAKERPDLIMISIAHRLSTIIHSDRIYVLEKGKLIEKGNHRDLLKHKGLYYSLWREQIAEG